MCCLSWVLLAVLFDLPWIGWCFSSYTWLAGLWLRELFMQVVIFDAFVFCYVCFDGLFGFVSLLGFGFWCWLYCEKLLLIIVLLFIMFVVCFVWIFGLITYGFVWRGLYYWFALSLNT